MKFVFITKTVGTMNTAPPTLSKTWWWHASVHSETHSLPSLLIRLSFPYVHHNPLHK